jgi:hypothetical protein
LIVLERQYPEKAAKAAVLLGRLPANYPKLPAIEADYRREDAGYWGEKALDYYLSFLPEDEYCIFQHLRLKFGKWTFQIDFLLLTIKFALIVEAKNYAGKLHYERKFNQLIQTHHEKEKVYDDPMAQAERQQRLLTMWIKKYFSHPIPVNYLVVMSNTNAMLTTDSEQFSKKVCKPYKLLNKVENIANSYQTNCIDMKDLKKLCKLLLKHHTPKQYNIPEEYQIPKEDILTGVKCPHCQALPMVYKRAKWHCPSCKASSKDAHLAAVEEYFLLFKPWITSSELKEFLRLPSSSVARKLLSRMNLLTAGNTKNRIYYQRRPGH